MVALRIFSYLPNPRIWKATITARLCDVEVEVRGASPNELSQWLWDFDARPIANVPRDMLAGAERIGRVGFADQKLYKTDAFLEAQPFGTVPAAFSPDGHIGIFESNSIMRAVARISRPRQGYLMRFCIMWWQQCERVAYRVLSHAKSRKDLAQGRRRAPNTAE
jgi:hypothetical protein